MSSGITRWWQLDVALGVALYVGVTYLAAVGRYFPLDVAVIWTLLVCGGLVAAHLWSTGEGRSASLVRRPNVASGGVAEKIGLQRWRVHGGYIVLMFALILVFQAGLLPLFEHLFGAALTPPSLRPQAEPSAARAYWVLWSVYGVVNAPLVEEFAFRGWTQQALVRRFGAVAGVAASAALFALAHVTPWRPVWLTSVHLVIGTAFGAAAYLSRSLWTAIIMHAGYNALAMLAGAGIYPLLALGRTPAGLILCMAFMLLSAVGFVLLCGHLVAHASGYPPGSPAAAKALPIAGP